MPWTSMLLLMYMVLEISHVNVARDSHLFLVIQVFLGVVFEYNNVKRKYRMQVEVHMAYGP